MPIFWTSISALLNEKNQGNGTRLEGIRAWRKQSWLGAGRKLKFRPRAGIRNLLAKLSTVIKKKKKIQWQRIRQAEENFDSELRCLNNNNNKEAVSKACLYIIACYVLGFVFSLEPVTGSFHSFTHGPCPNYSNLWSDAFWKASFHCMPTTQIGIHHLSWAIRMASWLLQYLTYFLL